MLVPQIRIDDEIVESDVRHHASSFHSCTRRWTVSHSVQWRTCTIVARFSVQGSGVKVMERFAKSVGLAPRKALGADKRDDSAQSTICVEAEDDMQSKNRLRALVLM